MQACLLIISLLLQPGTVLDRAQQAIGTFRVEEALRLLDQAKDAGPHRLGDHARLFEQYAIAYAYLDRREDALRAFDMLLALAPGHAIRYTLSPKVTLLFEEARRNAVRRQPPQIAVNLPRDRSVSDALPLDIEVLGDDRRLLARGAVFWRRRGGRDFQRTDVTLAGPGQPVRVVLPPVAPRATRAQTAEIYLVGFDRRGNEVYHWHAAERPRELTLSYQPPRRWYGKWWVWVLAGTAVAAGVGATVFAVTREPPAHVDATAEVLR